jgi:hypothetical protein
MDFNWVWRKEFKLKEGRNCTKNDLFYQSICHPLRLLKIPQINILGDLHSLKGSFFFVWVLIQPHCLWKLPTKLHALTHPLSVLANWERLWTSDLDKSQVRGRYNCIRDVRRSHSWTFCVCSAGVNMCLHTFGQKKLPCQDFLSLMCLFLALECL